MSQNKFIASYRVGTRDSSIVENCLNSLLAKLKFVGASSFEIHRMSKTVTSYSTNARNLVLWCNVMYWKARSVREPDVSDKETNLTRLIT